MDITARTRKYASFFEWPEKTGKELNVVEELLPALNAVGLKLRHLRAQSPDPPDFVCDDPSGRRVAIEVTEIVCEEAVRLNAQGRDVYRDWRSGDLGAAITARLSEKDTKTFHGGPFSTVVICLFTDEPALTFDFAERELASARFGPYKQIGAAYLLFSYDPGSTRYPLLQMRMTT